MSKNNIPNSIDDVDGLSKEARDALRAIPFHKEQFEYLQNSPTEIMMINRFVAEKGAFNLDRESFTTSYTWPKTSDTLGNINIGIAPEAIDANGNKIDMTKYLSFSSIAHELGHALGLYSKEMTEIDNDLASHSLDTFMQARADTEGEAALTQYQIYRENKNKDFLEQHWEFFERIEILAHNNQINPLGDKLFDPDVFYSPEGEAVRKAISSRMGQDIRNMIPNSQTGNDKVYALNYDETAKLDYLKGLTTILKASSDYFGQSVNEALSARELKNLANSVHSYQENGKHNVKLDYTTNEINKANYHFAVNYDSNGSPHVSIATLNKNGVKIKEMDNFSSSSSDGRITTTQSTITNFDDNGNRISSVKERSTIEKEGNKDIRIEEEKIIETANGKTEEKKTTTNNKDGSKLSIEVYDSPDKHKETTVFSPAPEDRKNKHGDTLLANTTTTIINDKNTGIQTIEEHNPFIGIDKKTQKQFGKNNGQYDFTGPSEIIYTETIDTNATTDKSDDSSTIFKKEESKGEIRETTITTYADGNTIQKRVTTILEKGIKIESIINDVDSISKQVITNYKKNENGIYDFDDKNIANSVSKISHKNNSYFQSIETDYEKGIQKITTNNNGVITHTTKQYTKGSDGGFDFTGESEIIYQKTDNSDGSSTTFNKETRGNEIIETTTTTDPNGHTVGETIVTTDSKTGVKTTVVKGENGATISTTTEQEDGNGKKTITTNMKGEDGKAIETTVEQNSQTGVQNVTVKNNQDNTVTTVETHYKSDKNGKYDFNGNNV